MELELKLEWLEGVSKNLGGGQAPQICLTLPQAIPTSIPIPVKIHLLQNWYENQLGKSVRKSEQLSK